MHTLKITDIAPNGVSSEKFELTLDGVPIKAVKSYSISRSAGAMTTLRLELNVAMELGDKSGVDVTHLGSTSREYIDASRVDVIGAVAEGFEQGSADDMAVR